jgi:hypothetical protein
MTPSNHKDNDQMPKPSSPSISPKNMEYDFLEDLKKTKSNISLFELMKLPHIQENFIKNLQRMTSNGTKEYSLGTKEGTTKYNLSTTTLHPRVKWPQMHPSLDKGQYLLLPLS